MTAGIAGYVDVKLIAQTADCVVHESVRVKDQLRVARKELIKTDHTIAIHRFKEEARLLARLDHPNIITVLDQHLSAPPYCLITPLYSTSLRRYLAQGRCSANDANQIFAQVLDATAYAHQQGVLHRDIKPENVLLNSPSEVVLIDFSVGRGPIDAPERVTKTGQFLGTFHYIAPEQLRDTKSCDERADVFSLGVLLYELYGGRVGSSALDVSSMPQHILPLVQKSTAANANHRFQSVQELRVAFRVACHFNSKQSEVNELESFILRAEPLSSSACSRLLELLQHSFDDVDRLDGFLMKAPITVLSGLAQANPFGLESAISIWTRFFASRQWPFAYTDDIAKRVEDIWQVANSSTSRALLTCAVLELGGLHNRYFVLRATGRLIEKTQSTDDVDALLQRFVQVDRDSLESIGPYVQRKRIDPRLRASLSVLAPDESDLDESPSTKGPSW